jgi:hypothetical protein
VITPGMLGGSAAERKLLRAFRALDPANRDSLLAFAEFLSARQAEAGSEATARAAPMSPAPAPRPADESVVAAIKRLRRGYPMLDSGTMLQETSALMAAHVLQGRNAEAVIDDLEALFATRYRALCAESEPHSG